MNTTRFSATLFTLVLAFPAHGAPVPTSEQQDLEVKRRMILPHVENDGLQRARIEAEVTGPEKELYQWLLEVHSPADFRVLTSLRLRPSKDDDSSVDVGAVFEQWHRLPDADEDAERAGADLRLLSESAHYPVELLLHIVQASPPKGLSLELAEITNQLDDGQLDRTIRLLPG